LQPDWQRRHPIAIPCRRKDVSDTPTGSGVCGTIHQKKSSAASLYAAEWLGLAATPTFALMALLTAVLGGGAMDMLCPTAHGASPLNGMVLMYALMSAFHSGPWLRLIVRRRNVDGCA
jgi:hypothetical protein